MEAKVIWEKGMAFSGCVGMHSVTMDASAGGGGHDSGISPKALLLVSVGGCTGMDVIAILKKMRQPVDRFSIRVKAIDIAPDHPRKINEILVEYDLGGTGIDVEKVKKAVSLSEEKYCGVAATLRPGTLIKSRIFVNESEVI